ncbi:MAG: M20/M25/M40 family metallo-hydrolase [Nitrospinota bacterium]
MGSSLEKVFEAIDDRFERSVEELKELLRIPTLSIEGKGIEEGARYVQGLLARAGLEARMLLSSDQPGGPPVVYGEREGPPGGRTVLLYGHYDVQSPGDEALWTSPPFEPTVREGRLYARGSADNRGQFFAHLKALEALDQAGAQVPVRVKMILEGEEEVGSPHLEAFVRAHPDLLRADVVYSADGGMHPSGRPTVFLGARGILPVRVVARGPKRDVHSGTYGGAVPNPAWRLVAFLAGLRDARGRVRIPGFYDDVRPLGAADREALARLPDEEEKILRDLGLDALSDDHEGRFSERVMFQPNLNVRGLEGGSRNTIIPAWVAANLDVRLVPHQKADDIFTKICAHARREGFGDLEIIREGGYNPSSTPPDHPDARAVVRATSLAWAEEALVVPSLGGSVPDYVFTEILGLPSIWGAYANHDMNNHAPDENLRLDCFRNAIRTTAAALFELAGVGS